MQKVSIVQNIRTLCANKRITLAELERLLNFSQGSISKWDNNSPSIDKITRVADFFSLSIDDLIGRTNESYFNPLTNEEAYKELQIFIQYLKFKYYKE